MTPTLSEENRSKLDAIVGKMHANNEPDENIQSLVNDFKGKYAEKPQPQTTLGKVGNFLKGNVYDPTIGSIGQGARDLMTPGSRMKGAHEVIQGGEKALLPVAATAAVMNPEVTIPALATGAVTGTVGQLAGKYIPKMFGASEDVSNLTGDVGGLVTGGMGAKYAPELAGAAKGAYQGFSNTPIYGKGGSPWLRAVIGEELGGLLGGREGRVAGGAAGYALPKITGAARGAIEGFKGNVSTPVAATPGKGLNLAQMQEAVKSGSMGIEDFEQNLSQLGYDPKAAKVISSNLQTSIAPKAKITPDEPPKTLSLGNLQSAVKNGLMDLDEFNARLAKQGYNKTDRGHLTELLKRQMEDDEEAQTAKDKKLKVESPKAQPPSEASNKPLTYEEAKTATNLKPGARMIHKDGSTWELKEVPIDKIDPDPGNRVEQGRVDYYKGNEAPPVELKTGENGRFNVFEGHHRITAADQQGKTSIKAWVPAGEQMSLLPEPNTSAFEETSAPHRAPISEQQIEESQSTDRAAKENKLAKHFSDKTKFPDLTNMPRTSEYLRAVGKEAGLKREPSLRTFENAIKKANMLRRE